MQTVGTAVLVALSLWVLCGEAGGKYRKDQADSLYQDALRGVGRVPVKESVRAFRRVLKADRRYAPAHNELAKLYMSRNTLQGRVDAREALEQALRLDPENLEYRLTQGDLMWAQGFWDNADKHYRELLEQDPENARAAYRIGQFAAKEYMKYGGMFTITRSADGLQMMDWREWGEEHRREALDYLRKSMRADPTFRDPYYQLGLLYYEMDRPQSLVEVFRRLLTYSPGDKDALLFCGLGYQATGDEEKAHAFYSKALSRMAPEERAVMESVDVIATVTERREIRKLEGRKGPPESWQDSAPRKRFWRRQDPLFLTDYNERRMEHYGRVAYANLRYSRPSHGIAGWQTDMGKAHIKFGRPAYRFTQRPAMEVEEQGPVITNHLETWVFEDFLVSFRNWDGLDHWAFDPGEPLPNVRDFGSSSDYFREFWSWGMPRGSSLHVYRKTPPRYVDPYREAKYSLPRLVAAFREPGATRLEISYAIPEGRLERSGPTGFLRLDDGVFLLDENGDDTYRKVYRHLELDPAGTDGLHREYLLSRRTVYVKPGRYTVITEVKDHHTGSIGTFRDVLQIEPPDSTLSMSDLLLASRIETRSFSPEGREDLTITPAPVRTYRRSDPVHIYLEVYNLTRDTFGRTRYDISYRMDWPDKDEVDPTLFDVQDLPEGQPYVEIRPVIQGPGGPGRGGFGDIGGPVRYEVAYVLPERNRVSSQVEDLRKRGKKTVTGVTARYEGSRKDDFTYLHIDAGRMPTGIHKLIVTVRDDRTGQTAERSVLFRVID